MIDDRIPQTMAMQQLQGSGMNDWYAGYAEGVNDGQKTAADRIEALEAALRELADLMDDVVSGNYKPDSFTTQPARAALAPEQDK